MKVIKASQIYTNVVRVPPFGIRKCNVWSRSLDSGQTVEMDNSFLTIVPFRGVLKFLTDLELKKIIIKPLVFQVIEEFAIENAYTADDNDNETYLKKGDKFRYRIDTGEALVYFKMNFADFNVIGHDGIIVPTNNRIAVIDLTDPDGNGIYVAGGKTCEFEIMVVDITALRALKSVKGFTGASNRVISEFKDPKNSVLRSSYYDTGVPAPSGDAECYSSLGYGNMALPYNIVLAVKKLVENGKLPADILKTNVKSIKDYAASEEDVKYNSLGKPVDIIFTGYYLNEEFC